jgi:hypothetical protein
MDKILHFLVGLIAAACVTEGLMLLGAGFGIAAAIGISVAMILEVLKIELYDIPNAVRDGREMDWIEKAWDAVAQFGGALFGVMLGAIGILLLTYAAFTAATLLITFVCYLAVMKLRDARDSGTLMALNWSVIWAAYLILAIGLIFDVALNIVLCTVMFLELPKELLTTDRIKRHCNHGGGWRQSLAAWWCRNWLAPFDSTHCDE